eukprot:scaffold5908_cov142-Skeletonema_menzelii.AAC.5
MVFLNNNSVRMPNITYPQINGRRLGKPGSGSGYSEVQLENISGICDIFFVVHELPSVQEQPSYVAALSYYFLQGDHSNLAEMGGNETMTM